MTLQTLCRPQYELPGPEARDSDPTNRILILTQPDMSPLAAQNPPANVAPLRIYHLFIAISRCNKHIVPVIETPFLDNHYVASTHSPVFVVERYARLLVFDLEVVSSISWGEIFSF